MYSNLVTTRSRNSELWFINNNKLTEATLGYMAKFSQRYETTIYAFGIEGNHIHLVSDFKKLNRSSFMRDFNSCVARSVTRFCEGYRGGSFWARRYSNEFLPGDMDTEDYFFYTVLQPVQDGLVDRISDYPGYNCFHDAVYEVKKKFKVVNWSAYNQAKVYREEVKISDYIETVEFQYKRLPGYEHMSKKEYVEMMLLKLEERRVMAIREREARGKKDSLGRSRLLKIRAGSYPKMTKKSDLHSFRPRVLSKCHDRRVPCLKWYFQKLDAYFISSKEYRNGNFSQPFPEGMYKPYLSWDG